MLEKGLVSACATHTTTGEVRATRMRIVAMLIAAVRHRLLRVGSRRFENMSNSLISSSALPYSEPAECSTLAGIDLPPDLNSQITWIVYDALALWQSTLIVLRFLSTGYRHFPSELPSTRRASQVIGRSKIF